MLKNTIRTILGAAALFFMLGISSVRAVATPQIMEDGEIFDAEYYAALHPEAVSEVGTGQNELYWHYLMYGKKKGYLPYANASAVKAGGCAIPCSAESFDYLALGNSILNHPIAEYWFAEYGMAASVPENDYFHRVSGFLMMKYGNVHASPVRFGVWELGDEWQKLFYLNALVPFLSRELDLVTIQLSENVHDLGTFEEDLTLLVQTIRQYAPNARIILVDDFWDRDKSAIKRRVASQLDLPFADLAGIRGSASYQNRIGEPVFDPVTGQGMVLNDFVASHPNDRGMLYIANRIIGQIQ